jgi:hypothetical protein
MKLPVDTSAIAFLCALEPQPLLNFQSKEQRADENGEPLYVVQLIALGEGEAEILAVKVPGMPSGIRQGHPVKITGLVAQPWTMNDHQPPADDDPRFRPGENTFSATPLAWSHAQFIRLARSIDAGRPVETPRVVACRYHTTLC